MLAITQFEVQVLQRGRWTIHARYPGEEKNVALRDAQDTELNTGFPTKVIRETYFPESNESERITTYVSPKAKQVKQPLVANERRRPNSPARSAATVTRRRADKGSLTGMQLVFRVIVAGGISLATATLITGVVAWFLNYLGESGGVGIAAETRTMLLTYSYVIMFLLIFYRLYRSHLPLHRLLADMWSKTAKAAQIMPEMPVIKPTQVKPKYEGRVTAEALREAEDMKLKRGDLDLDRPEELLEADATRALNPEPLPPMGPPALPEEPAEKIAPEKTAAEKAAEKKAKDKAEKKAKQAEAEPLEAAFESQKQAGANAAQAAKAEGDDAPETFNLERMVLRRFAVDVVKPAASSAMPNDPVARRGMAIILAGAAAGVAATAGLKPASETALLTDALQHIGINQPAIDSFMALRTQHLGAPANAGLLAAGRSALAAYLEGSIHVLTGLAQVLISWRTPIGHNLMPTPQLSFDQAHMVPLLDVYMLTELREGPTDNDAAIDALHDHDMGVHNGVVRTAVTAHGGQEVKHTGKGIFARFPGVRGAVEAASDIQRGFTEARSKLAIALVGNTVAGEDPLLSAKLVRQAQSIISRASGGEILCEAQVEAAIRRQEGDDRDDGENVAAESLDIVKIPVVEAPFEASSTQPTTLH